MTTRDCQSKIDAAVAKALTVFAKDIRGYLRRNRNTFTYSTLLTHTYNMEYKYKTGALK